ncbi:MAG: OmpA family protein [Cyclobacteriaceae bacterium]
MRRIHPLLVLLCCFTCLHESVAQEQSSAIPPLPDGNYVVVAAYRPDQSAIANRFAGTLKGQRLSPQLGLDPVRPYIYVWLEKHDDRKKAVQVMEQFRRQGFDRSWVRVIQVGNKTQPVVEITPPPVEMPLSPAPRVEVQSQQTTVASTIDTSAQVIKSTQVTVFVDTRKTDSARVVKKPVPPSTWLDANTLLSVYHGTTNKLLEGEIQIIDADRARMMKKVKTNARVHLPDPGSKSGKLLLIAEVFGFRKVQHEVVVSEAPGADVVHLDDSAHYFAELDFDLARLHKGDIATMYNVYFFKDAAIMQPESRFELNGLLDMLKEKQTYTIKLHGHTNGNSTGPIISLGDDKNFFSLSGNTRKGFGSAKKLSLERAETIREWLIAQGIDPARIQVKGWGGSRMIHDKNSNHAHRNVRVDVEVISE